MNDNVIKFLIGAGLFATWVGLTIHPVANSSDIIGFCKDSLVALGFYHVGASRGAPAANTFP